jgi:acetyltransferase-like isoleucine patch superfamily enzyme
MQKSLRTIVAEFYQKFRVFTLRLKGYDIDYTTRIERGYNFDRYNPQGVHIGKKTLVTSHVTINAHYLIPKNNSEYFIGEKVDTYIGEGCVVGVGATIMSGVKIGDYCVVGAGAVVTKDVPANCIVVGNPAKIIKENIVMHDIQL